MKGIIYIATNLFSGKSYIGQTRATLEERMRQHYQDSKKPNSVNHFHIALSQYGKSGFEWKVLDEFEGTKEEVIHALNVAEEYHILKRRTMLEEYGYNATKGGYSSDVFSKQVQRLANKGGAVAILQYDLKGNFIREYSSSKEIALMFGCKSIGTSIFNKQWRGFQWRRKDSMHFPRKIDAYIKPKRNSAVVVYNPNGEFYKEFPSINQCCADLGKQYSVKEFSYNIVRPSYLINNMLVFRKRENEYPLSINVTYKYPKQGGSSLRSDIPVMQYTRDGIFVKEYPSIISAHRETGICEKSIRDWCKKTPPLCIRSKKSEFLWQYKKDSHQSIIEVVGTERKQYVHKMEHKIVQLDNEGKVVAVWANMYQASLNTGESIGLIKKQCMGIPTKKQTASLWKYYHDYYGAV